MNTIRGTGRTRRQLNESAKGSVFVWCNEDLYCPKMLAKSIMREDIIIVGPSWFLQHRYMGKELRGITVDHATRITEELYRSLNHARGYIRNRRLGDEEGNV